jgi:hypothetical protein
MSHRTRPRGNQRAYVITDAPRPRTWPVRAYLLAAVALLMLALAFVGHVAALVLGALDALVTAAIGTRRIALLSRQLANVARDTWEASR